MAAAQSSTSPRPLRGLLLVFLLSFINLLGVFVTIMALGGFDAWTVTQFIGLFGLIEVGTGLAFIVGPNIWRLPVAEANTSERTQVRLAASTLLIPHWAAGAKAAAGVPLVIVAAVREGVGPATAGVLPLALMIFVIVMALSILMARFGVARPDLDVLFLVVKRPRRKDYELPGFSLGASFMQLITQMGALPAVKLMPPSIMYQPEFGPSVDLLAATALTTILLSVSAYLVWRGRITWRAPREQQREAEANA